MCAVIVALIIHWLFLLLCEYPLCPSGSRIFSGSRRVCPQHGERGRTCHDSSPPAQPHKSMPADLYRPITHSNDELSAVPLSRLCCGRWPGLNGRGEEGVWGGSEGGPLHCVGLTDHRTVQASAVNISSSLCSAAAAGHFQDLEKIRESDSICFPSLFPGESKGKTFPAVPPDWVRLT